MNSSKPHLAALKKHFLIFWLLVSSCASAVAQAIDVDDKTRNLIIDSITLDLVSDPLLKDVDGSPYLVYFNTMGVGNETINVADDNTSATYSYELRVTYETLSGHAGVMLCQASILVTATDRRALKGVCTASRYAGMSSRDIGLVDELY